MSRTVKLYNMVVAKTLLHRSEPLMGVTLKRGTAERRNGGTAEKTPYTKTRNGGKYPIH